MEIVYCVSVSLSSAPELHVHVALVSSVSPDPWGRLHFVGDFVGAASLGPMKARLETRLLCRDLREQRPRPLDRGDDPFALVDGEGLRQDGPGLVTAA
jgi:hypothetical protein